MLLSLKLINGTVTGPQTAVSVCCHLMATWAVDGQPLAGGAYVCVPLPPVDQLRLLLSMEARSTHPAARLLNPTIPGVC